ncbi:hypothetical protein KFE25_001313 [Diacronema lutheri]|uniref:diaminopimelate epimerase n=2 Tax=Diacronema lutheri TaxID=2081491 RepID=A0A8J5XME3_DIALT|nr:hypothetical protein KFE25_001313 [Diacronema lutheri]
MWAVALCAAAAVVRARPMMGAGGSQLAFSKYHGIGNDFILVDNRASRELLLTPAQAERMCDRNFGIGGDGVIFALPGEDGADYAMRIINSDGSEPEMCGNGIRCMAKFVAALEGRATSHTYTISTRAGPIIPALTADGLVAVDMGRPILDGAKVPTTLPADASGRVIGAPLDVAGRRWAVTCVSMGNPHAIVFVDSLDESSLPLSTIGPLFEKHAAFPARTNTEFVKVLSRTHLQMRVWERGAGATLACGTGACALLVAAVLNGLAERRATVSLPGGDLEIEWRESDGKITMTGPAELAYTGHVALD